MRYHSIICSAKIFPGGVLLRILFLGDVFAKAGRRAVTKRLRALAEKHGADFVIANGENASHGRGLSLSAARELYEAGVDFITLGNHTWSNNGFLILLKILPWYGRRTFHPPSPERDTLLYRRPAGRWGF